MVQVLRGEPGGVLAPDVVLQGVLARVQVPAQLAAELHLERRFRNDMSVRAECFTLHA